MTHKGWRGVKPQHNQSVDMFWATLVSWETYFVLKQEQNSPIPKEVVEVQAFEHIFPGKHQVFHLCNNKVYPYTF